MIVSNPAAHLHHLLTTFEATTGSSVGIRACWAKVLQVDEAMVPERLGAVIGLVPQIACALEGAGLADQLSVYQRNAEAWAAPMYFPGRGWGHQSTGLVDQAALDVLSGLASGIRAALDTQLLVVKAEQIKAAARLVQETRDAVAADRTMPGDVRKLILRRLADIQWAMDEIGSFGADGVENAVERLMAAMARAPEKAKTATSWKRVACTLGVLWAVFSTGSDVNDDLKAWGALIPGIEAQSKVVPKALESGATGASSTHADDADQEVVDAEVVDESDTCAQDELR